jgi:hypothetical protein
MEKIKGKIRKRFFCGAACQPASPTATWARPVSTLLPAATAPIAYDKTPVPSSSPFHAPSHAFLLPLAISGSGAARRGIFSPTGRAGQRLVARVSVELKAPIPSLAAVRTSVSCCAAPSSLVPPFGSAPPSSLLSLAQVAVTVSGARAHPNAANRRSRCHRLCRPVAGAPNAGRLPKPELRPSHRRCSWQPSNASTVPSRRPPRAAA